MSIILPLIEEAIDVPMMDIKNISKLIYEYIEYEVFSGPQYEVLLMLFDNRKRVCIFIHEGKFLAVEDTLKWFSAEDKGIIFNERGFVILGEGYDYIKELAKTCDKKEIYLCEGECDAIPRGFDINNNAGLENMLLEYYIEGFVSVWEKYLNL